MIKEEKKEAYEKLIFNEFLKKSGVVINTSTISQGDPNKKEPDILCNFIDGKNYGFELTEACCPECF